ncbi:CorA family divalent cation transporter [Pseudovibrio exalbescens]|uniref:Zinc transport protein ZntB n=1 Tax=Pseudovibrio exalbescens TaxID=197461 RepID=A0A1U7JIS1_9HYPH|nr:CorA family divalent cation transporter [Pseudovibrio exalbescens]OKL44650.1 hypothetical protein A3843_09790 [Pseudovibrio exalbescens]
MMEAQNNGERPVFAVCIGKDGSVRETSAAQAVAAGRTGSPDVYWLHIRQDRPEGAAVLAQLDLPEDICAELKQEDARPRCTISQNGALLNLYVFPVKPDALGATIDLLKLWVSDRLVVSVWNDTTGVLAALDLQIRRGLQLHSAAELVSALALILSDRAEELSEALADEIEDLEDLVLEQASQPWEAELARIRRRATVMRRSMFVQRDALRNFEIEDWGIVSRTAQIRLREAADRVIRIAEEMDAIRERAEIVHDQVMYKRSEMTNRYMLLLAIIAAIFLPLSLITGLLGINVGGIPGAHSPYGFAAVYGLLVLVAILQIYLVRFLRIF